MSLYNASVSSYLYDRTIVRSGAEIGLLSLTLSVSQGASLGDFSLAPVCPIEKVTLCEGFFYVASGSATDKILQKTKFLSELGIEPGTPGPKASALYH